MIINTGLLPTKEGAVCFRYPRNTFPSLSKLYKTSFNVIPGGQTVWNQSLMNTAYGIKDNFDGSLNDKNLIEQFIEKYNGYDYGMMLTMSTHSPFNAYAHLSNLSIPTGAPTSLSNYLKSFNYTDQCLATLFSAIESNEKLKNSTVVITAGTSLLLWIGDQITKRGIGNGLSLLIMAGIIQSMPSIFIGAFNALTALSDNKVLGGAIFASFVIVYLLIIIGMVWIQLAERRIPIQYANRTNSAYGKHQNFLPIKINSAGVMPVIFATTLLAIPATIINLVGNQTAIDFADKYLANTTPVGFVIYIVLILFFGYFYTFLQMNPEEMSKNLSKSGAYIPGVRPGNDTIDYVSNILSKLTIVGSIFLVIIAGLPIVFSSVSGLDPSITIGGTGLLIVVGVAIETYKQLESSLISRSHRAGIKR